MIWRHLNQELKKPNNALMAIRPQPRNHPTKSTQPRGCHSATFAKKIMRRHLIMLFSCACLTCCQKKSLDVVAIRNAVSNAEKGQVRDVALSAQLEDWYEAFGHTIKIDNPKENGHYMMAISIATSPDFDKIVRGDPEAKTPEVFLSNFLKENDLTTLPFDSQRWNQKLPSAHLRYRMFKGFLANHPPAGKTQANIEAILGPSDAEYSDRFSYGLGVSFGMGMEAMLVDFVLKDGKVIEYRFREP